MTLDDTNYPDKPNDHEAFWMPFTANRGYKQRPRLLSGAKGMHYTTPDGRAVLDGTAGLWCCNAGHGHPKIVAGIELEHRPGAPTARATEAFHKCFDEGVLIRVTADTIALSPPLIVEMNQIDRIFDTIGGVLKTVD